MVSQLDQLYRRLPTNVTFYQWMHDPCRDHWYMFVGGAVSYLVVIYLLVQIMKNRKPFSLRPLLIVWNALLSISSAAGAIIVVPFALLLLKERGFNRLICETDWMHYPAPVITIGLFLYSKIPELFDTVFLALRKRDIPLLHWYHHVTVLLYVWYGGINNIGGTGVIFAGMNLFVHAIMYGYYALMAAGVRVPFPILITVLQIVQMIIGTYTVVSCIPCSNQPGNHWSALAMYVSYALLFIHFFVQRYLLGGGKDKQKEA